MAKRKDNWKDRSKGMICGTCIFFVPKAPRKNFGRCRKRAPTLNGWPGMHDTDWCGDHKLDENKLEIINA